MRYFLEENKETANALVRKIVKAASARNAARKAREEARKGKGKQKTERVLSGKLASAQSKMHEEKNCILSKEIQLVVVLNKEEIPNIKLFCL